MWEQMTLEQRAQLWPLLTHEQRLLRWRHMTQDERRIMRKNMTPVERKNLKRRFVIDRLPPEEAKNLKTRKMTPAERELLRRQVIEVHVEMRGGVPYNCNDPTDCRRARKQSGLDVHQLRQTVPAETKVAKPAATPDCSCKSTGSCRCFRKRPRTHNALSSEAPNIPVTLKQR